MTQTEKLGIQATLVEVGSRLLHNYLLADEEEAARIAHRAGVRHQEGIDRGREDSGPIAESIAPEDYLA